VVAVVVVFIQVVVIDMDLLWEKLNERRALKSHHHPVRRNHLLALTMSSWRKAQAITTKSFLLHRQFPRKAATLSLWPRGEEQNHKSKLQ
jgi:hypothetical protein